MTFFVTFMIYLGEMLFTPQGKPNDQSRQLNEFFGEGTYGKFFLLNMAQQRCKMSILYSSLSYFLDNNMYEDFFQTLNRIDMLRAYIPRHFSRFAFNER